MGISAKGTYAIRALTDMATHNGANQCVCISSISTRLNVSRKYLESIMTLLAKNNMVDVTYGKCGGYKLNRNLKNYNLYDILMITEDSLKSVSCPCVGHDPGQCSEMETCTLLATLKQMHDLNINFLKSKTIEDLVNKQQ